MKKTTKEKAKKLGKLLIESVKETGKVVGKYGPKVHAFSKSVATSTVSSFSVPRGKPLPHLIPHQRKGYVDLTAKNKPRKIIKGKKGFYLDYTKK